MVFDIHSDERCCSAAARPTCGSPPPRSRCAPAASPTASILMCWAWPKPQCRFRSSPEHAPEREGERAAEPTGDRQTVLLFATNDGSRGAIPLSQVAQLEEFPRSSLERVGPLEVVQYRDEILP